MSVAQPQWHVKMLKALGESGKLFREMSFSIEKTSVTAKSRALKAEYTLELAQDLKAIHGLDAEQELANILSSEILAEINREVVRTVYTIAKPGAQNNVANAGRFDLDVDSNGRWSVEKFKGLMFQIERDANAIAQETRRGKGNFIITSADVASALAMSGTLDYSSGLTGAGGPSIGEVDDTGNLLVGTMNGRIKVYVDPYSANVSSIPTTMLLVIRVLPHMTQVSSTAHMYPSRWSDQLVLTPSNQKLDLRLATVWLLTHSLFSLTVLLTLRHLLLHATSTIVVLELRTSCDSRSQINTRGTERSPFFIK